MQQIDSPGYVRNWDYLFVYISFFSTLNIARR
jgi:hypothetical protein